VDKRREFIDELQLLLEKYGAQMAADDYWEGYAECGQDIRIIIEFDDLDEIDIGKYLDKDKIISLEPTKTI